MMNRSMRQVVSSWLGILGRSLAVLVVGVVALVGRSPQALACGGCFAAQSDTSGSFVTSHRMAFSISPERTVLWDQFSYTGYPEDFSWVLPVKPGAYVEQAEGAFLDALDQVTAPTVYAPPANCNGDACGCGLPGGAAAEADTLSSGGYDDGSGPWVQVISEETVGPYDTVVLRSTNEDALVRWLSDNGYAVQPNIAPIIEAYVAEGFDFLALRLSPGNGVNQMTPVRVITPFGSPELPLRMVAAGVGSEVQMTLFVFANTPMKIPDLKDVRIVAEDVTWNYRANTSDYDDIVWARLKENEGRVHLTTYAKPTPFTAESPLPNGFGSVLFVSQSGSVSTNLNELYFRLAGETGNLASLGEDCATQVRPYGSSTIVAGDCGPESESCPGGVKDGLGGGGGEASKPDSDEGAFACGGFTDIQTALVGHVPRSVWLTRLDMKLPRSALDHDCALIAADTRDEIEPHMEAGKVKYHPCNPFLGVAVAPPRKYGGSGGELPALLFSALVIAGLFIRKQLPKGMTAAAGA